MAIKIDIERIAGDNYPVVISNLKVDGEVADLTTATGDFSYIKDGVTIVIPASNGDALGNIVFIPAANDFDTAGTFKYDITLSDGVFNTTYFYGNLKIIESI
jgi:hypothetical protein